MKPYEVSSPPERWAAGLVAFVASAAVLSCALLLFAEDGRTPWVGEGSEYADEVERCQEQRSSSDRHRCVRQVAALAALGASAPVMLSRR